MSAAGSTAPTGGWRGWSTYRRGALVLVVASLAWRGWTTSRWTWDFDDWVYLADAKSMPLGQYLIQDYNGHLMPSEFLLSWLVTALAPLDFTVPVVLVAVGCAASTWVWSRALAAVAGERTVVLLPLALLTLSPLAIRPTIWWASALQVIPLQLFTGLAVLVTARYAATRSSRDLGLLVLILLGALSFWEKAVLILIPVAGVLLHATPGTLLERVRRSLGLVVVLGAVVAAYLAAYLTLAPGTEDDLGPVVDLGAGRGFADSVDFLWRGLGDLMAPALLGGPWGTMPLSDNPFIRPPAVVAWVSAALALALLVWAARRYRDSWLPLLMAGTYTAVSLTLVLYSRRFDVLGTTAVNDERYVVDAFAVAMLAVAMLLSAAPRTQGGRQPTPLPRWLVTTLSTALTVSLVAGNVAAVTRIGVHPGRAWVDQVTADIDAQRQVTVLDAYSPDRVLPPAFWAGDARLSRMLSPLPAIAFDGPADQLYAVDDEGRLRALEVDVSSTTVGGPEKDCGYAVEAGTTVAAATTVSLFALDWLVQVDTLAAQGGTLTIDLGDRSVSMPVGPGLGQQQFAYNGAVGRIIELSMSPDSGTVCVIGVSVGNPEIAPDE